MDHNKGMSMVEIIIVIAILAILIGASVGGINYIRYGNTKKCVHEIDAMIDRVRIEDMSKTPKPFLYLYEFDGAYYMMVTANAAPALDATGTRIANNQVQLCYRTSTMTPTNADIVISSIAVPANFMKIGFIKNTGGVAFFDGGTSYYNQILVKDNNGILQYTITLIQATGKHFID